jgi:predicted metal-dependent hydrolase
MEKWSVSVFPPALEQTKKLRQDIKAFMPQEGIYPYGNQYLPVN